MECGLIDFQYGGAESRRIFSEIKTSMFVIIMKKTILNLHTPHPASPCGEEKYQ